MRRLIKYLVVLCAGVIVGVLIAWHSTPGNIQLEADLTCATTKSSNTMAQYIMSHYGKDKSLSNINYYLYRHGYYIRNIYERKYIYISNNEGSKCLLGIMSVDTNKIVATIDENGKVLYLGDD